MAFDHTRRAWRDDGPRPLAWSAWYPCRAGCGAAPEPGLFDLGGLAENADLISAASFPVVLLSHGTGGSPESLGWLATALAERGYVVIGAHHHGNTGREPYAAEGFLCWWERATDVSRLLTLLSGEGPFAGRLDLADVQVVGFSLGAYTALALAGATTDFQQFLDWAEHHMPGLSGPPEFPELMERLPVLLKTSDVFRAAWGRQGDDHRDPRVGSIVAIAPPPPVRAFRETTVQGLDLPILLLTGEADEEAPTERCAKWLLRLNPAIQHKSFGRDVGHYSFTGLPSGDIPEEAAFLFQDAPGLSRPKLHEDVIATVLAHLGTPQ